ILQSYDYFYPSTLVFDKNAVDTLLSVVASISGVFLGLYFTAISGIASNFLTRATQDVRQFFLSIPTAQQYIQTVAMTGIISIFYIVGKSFGYTIHPVGLAFLALLAAYIIIRFWSVGSSVFNSMEPSSSMPWISKDIFELIKGATPPGFRWDKPVMQNHQRTGAAYQLELVSNLLKFDVREIKISDRQLLTALGYFGGLLLAYSGEKKKIPTESYWYKTKIQSENWAFADSARVIVAMNTGTALQPKTVKDKTWFEEQLLDIVLYVLQLFVNQKRDGGVNIGSAFEGLEVFVSIAESYGEDLDEPAIKMVLQKAEHLTQPVYRITPSEEDVQERKAQIAFVDSQGRLASAVLLGLMKYIDKRSAQDLSADIAKIDWESHGGIYRSGLPSPLLGRLESISIDLRNERTIEGARLTPDWYVRTLVVQQYLFSLQKYYAYVKSLHADYFEKKLSQLLADGHERLDLAVHLIQRWIEFSEKYEALVRIVQKHVEDCNQFHQVKDLPWTKFDFEGEEKIAKDRKKEVVNKLIALLPKLQTLVIDDDLPDYFGQALTLGMQACYEACETNDHERLRTIFPVVFVSSLAAYELIKAKVQSWSEEESKIIYSTEPLINLLEISGYAKLYAELHQNLGLWTPVEGAWNLYLGGVEQARGIIQLFAAIVTYRDSIFKIMPREELRSNWLGRFGHKMEELGLRGFPVGGDRRRRDLETPPHPSAVIRVISHWGGLMAFSARSVFIAVYLSVQPAAEGIEFPDRHDLSDLIRREETDPTEDEDDAD
ncbi:MAG: hypothetical protein B7X03_03745, partial [Parcubacteria group bacterium 21-58-10]